MIKMAWKRIFNRKMHSMAAILAMAGIFTIVPLGLYVAKESKLTVEETISQYGRGSYDILVRPAGARTSIEKKLGVVEENYVGDGSGGISIAEWEEIKKHKDIEIAAPVASLGYFAGNRTSVGLPLLEHPARFTWRFFTSDGLNKYPIGEPNVVTYFEGKPMEYVEYYAPRNSTVGFMGIRMPQNYYLLVAIDAESEGKLTGIDFSGLNRKIETGSQEYMIIQGLLEGRGNVPVIPVLKRSDLNIPLYLSLTVEELDISLSEYKKRFGVKPDEPIFAVDPELEQDLLEALNEEPALSRKQYDIDLSSFQGPFDGTYVELTNDFQVVKGQGGPLANDTAIYYTASKIQYDIGDDLISVAKVKDEQPPLYKEVKQQGKSFLEDFDAPFMLWQMGTFTPLSKKDELTSSPLGIYSTEEVKTMDGTTLTPTISPGSFIAAPAAGVTTLEAARIIKGEKPIDAIRIRVAGIQSYDQEAQKKIEKVATDLLKKGYEVDIVAGSSFKKLEMDVEGIGRVTSPWTTLGVAQSLTSRWNAVTLTTTVLFALFGLLYLSSRLLYERNALSEENKILLTLGWQKNKISLRNRLEQQICLTMAFMIGILILFISPFNTNRSIYLAPFFLWLISLGSAWILLNRNSKPVPGGTAYKKWASIFYYRKLIIPIMLVLTFSVILIVIQAAVIFSSILEARRTSLGAFTMDAAAYFHASALIITLLLTILSVSEAMNAILNERKAEFQMYHAIGWTRNTIRRHFGKEVSAWAGASMAAAGAMSLAILPLLNISIGWILASYSCALILFMILLTTMVCKKI